MIEIDARAFNPHCDLPILFWDLDVRHPTADAWCMWALGPVWVPVEGLVGRSLELDVPEAPVQGAAEVT